MYTRTHTTPAGFGWFLHCGSGSVTSSHAGCFFCGGRGRALKAAARVNSLSPVGFYSRQRRRYSNVLLLLKILVPISPSPFSNLQVFQKCTVKDVGVKNLVEPTSRIEPQIRELRPGALLPLKEKKVNYPPPRGYRPNRLPLPAV